MKRNYTILSVILSMVVFQVSCMRPKLIQEIPVVESEQVKMMEGSQQEVAKNVILLIGDGMGLTQITSGLYANGNKLNLQEFRKIGLHKCNSYDDLITDSAAGATAFSTGQKTYNGAIGVGPDTTALLTILEEAIQKGNRTGLVTSSTIVHATPASFAAHNRHRKNYEEIALDMSDSGVDVMIGGGLKYFKRRKDDRNLITDFSNSAYYCSDFLKEELETIDFNQHEKLFYLTSDTDPIPAAQGRTYLPIASRKAMEFLQLKSNEKGFFLMIEGAQIDWGGHSNDGAYITSEMIDFDNVIAEALAFQVLHPETLIIVTADHETGGMAINKGSKMDSLDIKFTSDYHTADLIPVFAKGPSSDLFMGFYENTDIFQKIRSAFGW